MGQAGDPVMIWITRAPQQLWLFLAGVAVFWTGAAEAIVEASTGPLKATRVMIVVVAAAALFLAAFWEDPSDGSDVYS